uniref:UDP-glucuronosyltransferase n=1 Tax=Trialeurodes vaporariorum TaxID=88556 RepID=A0A873P532_TRIVP|nr:UDP-gluconosyltransferase [Trialeurodes vaporariorum]
MHSHQQPATALTEALIKRGHQLVVIGPRVVPGMENNYTFVDSSFGNSTRPWNSLFNRRLTKWDLLEIIPEEVERTKSFFEGEKVHKFLREKEHIIFDVVIGESWLMSYVCGITQLLARGKPIIGFSSLPNQPFCEESLGSINHLSFVPLYDPYTDRMSIWQKLNNWFTAFYIRRKLLHIFKIKIQQFFDEKFGPGLEYQVDSCSHMLDLQLIASNFLYGYPRLLSPNVIELGPMHIKPPEKLPQRIQDWLDRAEKGVIYFSFGTNMLSKNLPADALSNFLKVFKELPIGYRVLWKWEKDGEIPGQSENILVEKWLPQQSVLAHPKVKAFITQGGLQSFQEAVHFEVPLIGTPWFFDQMKNVAKIVDAGIGVQLNPEQLHSYEDIKIAVLTVLLNGSFAANMKRLSAISKDFTSTALDKAVFWVEHVAKHGGAPHLRPSTADTTYFEFFCLDILSVILVISLIDIGICFSASGEINDDAESSSPVRYLVLRFVIHQSELNLMKLTNETNRPFS